MLFGSRGKAASPQAADERIDRDAARKGAAVRARPHFSVAAGAPAQLAHIGPDDRAMAERIAALRDRVGRMSAGQIYDAARQLQGDARARGLAILESLAGQMLLQMGAHGGRGTALAYLDVMAQAAHGPADGQANGGAEGWLGLAALRLGH